MPKTKHKRAGWIGAWERDDALRRAVVASLIEVAATHFRETRELQRVQAEANRAQANALLLAVQSLTKDRPL